MRQFGPLVVTAVRPYAHGNQLRKLRDFAAGWGADLCERPWRRPVGLDCVHRDSRLFPAWPGALVVRAAQCQRSCSWGALSVLVARVSDARSASEVSNSVEQLHPRLCWGWPRYDLGPNQRSGFVDGQGDACQRRPRTEYGTCRVSRRSLSNCGGGPGSLGRGHSPAFMGGRMSAWLRRSVSSERP